MKIAILAFVAAAFAGSACMGLEPWQEEINQNVRRSLAHWQNVVIEEAHRMAGEPPAPPESMPSKEQQRLDVLGNEEKTARENVERIEQRLKSMRGKRGGAWKRLISKDETRLAETRAELSILKEEARKLVKQIEEDKPKREAEYQRAKADHTARVREIADDLKFDESQFGLLGNRDRTLGVFDDKRLAANPDTECPFGCLDFERLSPGSVGRILPYDFASLSHVEPSIRSSVNRGLLLTNADWSLFGNARRDFLNAMGQPNWPKSGRAAMSLLDAFGETPPGTPANAMIVQVIDERQAIACPLLVAGTAPKNFWLLADTKAFSDRRVVFLGGIYLFMRNRTYNAVSGATETIPELVPVDLKTLIERNGFFN